MTVPEMLQKHGIDRPIDLSRRLQIKPQAAHRIWAGKVKLGRKMLDLLLQAGIPADELLRASGGETIYRPRRKRQPA
jgi:hypothetical protein